MAHVSHKLKNAIEGAFAGGGDPATSPLYVFGPFLKLIVVAGVAQITFGSSVWLAVVTIAIVSAMYRLVMRWVTDGSGGSGLSEEEFGSWAVKTNAAITFVEYTLTFLVSMAAMVTFIADRAPVLNEAIFGIQYRTFVAIILSILTGWLVNRGPKVATLTFGPATAGVLLLLWAMIISTLIKEGFQLPTLDLKAFTPKYLDFTIGGYVRILAVMTGIEVFANLVAAYDGDKATKARRAFQSLVIIMGTTAATMLIVGPAIYKFSDPTNTEISVFTQTMDYLLPDPLPIIGTMVGIAVLMSASAASAQGLQNLALGLKERHYIPPMLGKRNKFDVADKPVMIEVGIVVLCFILFGTNEETYLSLYAAGVFVLLSMTGWAVTKRLLREVREQFKFGNTLLLGGVIVAALLTTSATIIIFEERFFEGAWGYFVFIPILYAIFTYFRNRIGDPSPEMDYLGGINAALLAGFGFGQFSTAGVESGGNGNGNGFRQQLSLTWQPDPIEKSIWRDQRVAIERVAILLDGSDYAAQALPLAELICSKINARLTLLSSNKALENYLCEVAENLMRSGIKVNCVINPISPAEAANQLVQEKDIHLVITTTRGKSGEKHWLTGGLSSKLVNLLDIPVLLVQTTEEGETKPPLSIKHILVALDGSIHSEQTLPYARLLGNSFDSELTLLTVPAVPESMHYRAPSNIIKTIRTKAEMNMKKFNNAVARSLRQDELSVKSRVTGTLPARTIVSISEDEQADLIMLTSQGRGGLDLFFMGSVAQNVVQNADLPVFIIPINRTGETFVNPSN